MGAWQVGMGQLVHRHFSSLYGGLCHTLGLGHRTVGGGSIREAIRKGFEKARFLQPGDVVEHEVEGIGVLRGTIGPKPDLDPNYRYQVKNPSPVPEFGISKDYKYVRKSS